MRDTTDEWQTAMKRGDFAAAWRISDRHLAARMRRNQPQHVLPRHFQSIWDGSRLAGKRVLVRCYHGLGDTVQFIRFAAPLRTTAREVIVWCQPALMSLVATAAGVDRVLPLHDGAPDIAYDTDIEIMELAHALRIDASDLPGPIPYLHPSIPHRLPKASNRLNVGLIWMAGGWDTRRTLQLMSLAPLAHLENLTLVSLQRGCTDIDRASLPMLDASTDDVETLAATLKRLDLLISVDTFVAHLAGALGVPVWLLLHADCDWRWRDRGTRSIWYPTMRLFRQPTPGAWAPVVAQVASELNTWARNIGEARVRQEQTTTADVRTS